MEEYEIDAYNESTERIINVLIIDYYRTENDEDYISPLSDYDIFSLRSTTEKLTKILDLIKI